MVRILQQCRRQETQVRLLGREDPLEEGMATRSSVLVWRMPWTEEPGGLQFMGSQESDTTGAAEHSHTQLDLARGAPALDPEHLGRAPSAPTVCFV